MLDISVTLHIQSGMRDIFVPCFSNWIKGDYSLMFVLNCKPWGISELHRMLNVLPAYVAFFRQAE